jgi:hypothetical protein
MFIHDGGYSELDEIGYTINWKFDPRRSQAMNERSERLQSEQAIFVAYWWSLGKTPHSSCGFALHKEFGPRIRILVSFSNFDFF